MTTLHYITDPLCGWCWAAAPVIEAAHAAAVQHDIKFEILHRGLFTGDMVRWMSNSFSDYVMDADARISALSGQPFSDAYKENLLYNPTLIFDSWPSALALQAVKQLAPDQDYSFFTALQRVRFDAGKVITDSSVLTETAASVGLKAIDIHNLMHYDPSIAEAAKAEQRRAISLQNQVLSQGVPCLLLELDESLIRLPHENWLAKPEGFADLIRRHLL